MASVILVAFCVALFLYRIYKFCFFREKNFPPGPLRLPSIGSYFLLFLIDHKNLHLAVQKLCKYYKTNVVGFYVGNLFVVVSNTPETVREVLFNPDFDGRQDIFLARLREENFKLRGIFFIDGLYWQDQRRFTLRNMRDFGFGRRFEEYELEVRNEMESLVQMLKENPKYPHESEFLRPDGVALLPKALIGCVGNCFLRIVANERLPRCEQDKLFK